MSTVQGNNPGVMSNFDLGLAYFAEFGGVTSDIEELKRKWHTCTVAQLRAAVSHATVVRHRDQAEVNQYLLYLFGPMT